MEQLSKKRKRRDDKSSKSTSVISPDPPQDSSEARIQLLEQQIVESRRHYNNIASITSILKQENADEPVKISAAIALCRVFSRLLVGRHMIKSKGTPEEELLIIQWLKERYNEYQPELLAWIHDRSSLKQTTAITLLMRLVKQETAKLQDSDDYDWKRGPFRRLINKIMTSKDSHSARDDFSASYVEKFDDVRFYTMQMISLYLEESAEHVVHVCAIENALALLTNLNHIPETKDDLNEFYVSQPKHLKHQLLSPSAHKRQAQRVWLSVIRSGLSNEQRKTILRIMTSHIAPWFVNAEQLMDFLTDSYNVGGSTSLLALSGLFFLIQEKNLDYPSFYHKLYSLLDWSVLHSKHRSRFFRLLDTFMASTHLPAALVASFIKRLSRLALHGPPAGVVLVVPWIYNMFVQHPACTFMMHRAPRTPEEKIELENEGLNDPFDMEEEDPMETGALESSVWELETLQSHYHPNVATLARIISEQFTKKSYNLEDFLDYSYNSIIEAELGKGLKKAPVVEYEIPKTILANNESRLGSMMKAVLES